MTNEEIIEHVKHNSRISFSMNDYINAVYSDASENESDSWHVVCLEGSDFKYGHYYIDPVKKLKRNATFQEFYRGGIVD